MPVHVRPVDTSDRDRWGQLYAAYADFYQVTQTEEMRDRVWSWLMDDHHAVCGLVAVSDGRLVGFAHFRGFDRPLAAATGGFLDDLFVDPDARGRGAADALIAEVKAEGKARGWGLVRWITAEDNARARAVYDKTARATSWVTYDLDVT